MKRRQYNYFSIAILFVAPLLTFGCEETSETPSNDVLDEIVFGISANVEATRSEYSGLDENGQTITSSSKSEKINWLDTDKVRVSCAQAMYSGANRFIDYCVSPLGEGATKASLLPISSEKMLWGETFPHLFYASYPSIPIEMDNSSAGAKISVNIPLKQNVTLKGNTLEPDMDFAYMYAFTKAISKGPVNLVFKPLVTSLEFSLLSIADAFSSALLTVKLTSTQTDSFLSGKLTAEISSEGQVTVGSIEGTNEIQIDLPEGGVQLTSEDPYTITFLCLPVNQSSLTLELGFADGTSRKLPLKSNGNWITVSACKKAYFHKIGVPSEVWSYYISTTDPTPFSFSGGTSDSGTVLSYKEKGSSKIPVEWVVEGYYSDSECSNQIEKPEWLESIPFSGLGATETPEHLTITCSASSAQEETIGDYAQEVNTEIASSTFGSGSSTSQYFNLSNPLNMTSDVIVESANSYIINGPGYYKIPLVMGNGIVNGSLNPRPKSYQGSSSDYGIVFQDYREQTIESPYLHKSNSVEGKQPGIPTSAFVVWEDKNDLIEVINTTDFVLSDHPISYDSNNDLYWLQFHVIGSAQGNAVIAITDEHSEVMWSYHLWITNYIPVNYPNSSESDVTIIPHEDNYSYRIMPFNLGWIHSGSAKQITYPEHAVFVRLKQTEGKASAVMYVKQNGVVLFESDGYSPYYQWGRKDALWPSDGTDSNRHVTCYGKNAIQENYAGRVDLGTAIRNPGIFYRYSGSWFSIINQNRGYNLWDADNTETSLSYNLPVKTIYDPSPANYLVPPSGTFTGATVSGNGITGGVSSSRANVVGSFSRGWHFWTDKTQSCALFFPACGRLKYSEGTLEYVSKRGHYWTSQPSDNNGKSYYFYMMSDQINPKSPDGNHASGFVVRPIQQ